MKNFRFPLAKLTTAIAAACLLPSVMSQTMPVEGTSPYASIPLNLQSVTFIPPNVMLLLDTSGSMGAANSGGTRLSVAKNVTKNLFAGNANVRWGLAHFNTVSYNGKYHAEVRREIADYSPAHLANLNASVDALNTAGATAMADAFLDMYDYFAGRYVPRNQTAALASPMQYRCQKNYTMLVTDGEPNSSLPTSHPVLGSFPGISYSNFAPMSKLAYTQNMGLTGNDLDGEPFNTYRQYMSTYTVGFTINLALLKTMAEQAGGEYFTAGNEAQLTQAFQKAIQSIVNKTSSVPAPVSVNQPSVGMVQVGFETENWSGSVRSRQVDVNGNIGTTVTEATVPAASDRKLITHYGAGTRAFTEISPTNAAMLADTATFGSNPGWTLRFLKGEEPTTDVTWRKRNGNVLGDFIHTEPLQLGKLTANSDDFVAGANDGLLHYFRRNSPSAAYSELFAYAPSATLSKVQHVARRDYGQVTNPHRYLVDGSLVTQKLFDTVGGNQQLLVGALGRGGKGLYALNLTNATASLPKDIGLNVGLWDINSDDLGVWNGGLNMGYTFGRPVIAKVKQPLTAVGAEPWMVIAGNGYDSGAAHPSSTGRSGVFFFNAKTGTRMGNVMLPTSGSKPGIGGIAVMDKDNDNVADVVYAADRNGDIWRIDLKEELHGTNADDQLNTKAYKIWQGSPDQPITMSPSLYRINSNEVMVLFGTGSLLNQGDKSDRQRQTVYGLRDNLSAPPTTYSYAADRGSSGRLLKQEILEEKTSGGETYRKVSQNKRPADNSKNGGWYLDLTVGADSAERVTQPMMVLTNGVFFTTQIPSISAVDQCNSSGGDGWIMGISAVTGAAPNDPIIAPGLADFTSGKAAVAGFKANNMGMPSALGLVSTGESASGWSTTPYKNASGLIDNRSSYMESGFLAGLKLVFFSEDGSKNEKSILADNKVVQGYRLSWREI